MERVYNQINCKEKIEEETGGYSPGEVYLYKKRDEEPESIDRWNGMKIEKRWGKEYSRSVYDTKSGNFHIVPVEYEEINEKIVDAREMIIEKLKVPKGEIDGEGSRGVTGCPLVIEKCVHVIDKDKISY